MRSKGEGTVQLKPGTKTWFAKVPVGKYPNGKTKFKQITAPTKAKAEKIRLELISQRDQGIRLDLGNQTFREYAEWFYAVEAVHKIRPQTIGNYQQMLAKQVYPTFGARKLHEITRQELVGHLNHLRQDYAASTVNQVKAIISGIYRSAILNNLVDLNPCRDIPRFNLRRDEELNVFEPWSIEEAQEALKTAQGTEFETFLVLMLHTALRLGECIGLHWSDIDFEQSTLRVQRTLREGTQTFPDGRRKSFLQYNDPKTKHGNRIIDLAPAALDALVKEKKRQEDVKEWLPEWIDSDCIFTNEIGTELWPSTFSGRYRRWLRNDSGLRYIRIHDLRHTFAHLAVDQGSSFEAIQDVLGHSSPTITKTIYGRGITSLKRDATRGVGRVLEGSA